LRRNRTESPLNLPLRSRFQDEDKQVKIWIPGCKGLLGRYVCEQSKKDHQLIGTDIEVDVTKSLDKFLKKINPEAVVYCAAYKDSDKCEANEKIAYKTNAVAIQKIYKFNPNILFIYPSTASVFCEKKLYKETDHPSVECVYSRTKVLAEGLIQSFNRHYILRLSNLYGWGQQNFATWIYASAKNMVPPVKVTTDMVCQPTNSFHVAECIGKLLQEKPPFGTYHLCTPEKITRKEFAERLYKQMGIEKLYPFEKITLADLNLPAKRPVHAVLDCSKWEKLMGNLPTHEEGIRRFLNERQKVLS